MSASRSRRSVLLTRAGWTVLVLTVVVQPVLRWAGVPQLRVDAGTAAGTILVLTSALLYTALIGSWVVSRINDGWDEEAREERAARAALRAARRTEV